MFEESPQSSKRLLDPMERISEVLFGLIMVLCITGSISIAEAGREEVRTMLIGALGCNVAWGIVDGVFYLMTRLSERGRGVMMLRALRRAAGSREADGIIAGALPPLVASVLTTTEFEVVRDRLNHLPHPPVCLQLTKEDWLRATGVFLLVALSTFPVVIPFMVTSHARLALLISNSIAIVMSFLTGYAFGRHAGHHPGLGWLHWAPYWLASRRLSEGESRAGLN